MKSIIETRVIRRQQVWVSCERQRNLIHFRWGQECGEFMVQQSSNQMWHHLVAYTNILTAEPNYWHIIWRWRNIREFSEVNYEISASAGLPRACEHQATQSAGLLSRTRAMIITWALCRYVFLSYVCSFSINSPRFSGWCNIYCVRFEHN
jgi:hypothetical protein